MASPAPRRGARGCGDDYGSALRANVHPCRLERREKAWVDRPFTVGGRVELGDSAVFRLPVDCRSHGQGDSRSTKGKTRHGCGFDSGSRGSPNDMAVDNKIEEAERDVARGDAPETPMFVLGRVTLVIAAVAAVVIAVAVLVWLYA